MTARRRARRAVLLGLVLFALGQAALAAILLVDGLSVRDPVQGRKLGYLRRRLAVDAAEPRPLTVVQVGSSRTAVGLRGREVEPWLAGRLGRRVVLFNMGFLGDGPIRTLVKVKQLLHEGIRPDLLLVEVLPPLLAEETLASQAASHSIPPRHLRYAEMRLVTDCVGSERPDLERQWWLAQARASWTYRVPVLARFAPTLLPFDARWDPMWDIDDSGWRSVSHDATMAPRALAAVRKTFVPLLGGFRLSPRLLGAVDQTIELIRREGVQGAVVVMPEGPLFQSWYPAGVWEQIERALTERCRAAGVPLLDFRTGEEEAGFSDSHHLYPPAASRFTRRLAERIEPLLGENLGQERSPDAPG